MKKKKNGEKRGQEFHLHIMRKLKLKKTSFMKIYNFIKDQDDLGNGKKDIQRRSNKIKNL